MAATTDNGAASGNYLDPANYASLDEVGWNSSSVRTLYNYSENASTHKAWLTMSCYGAYVAWNEGKHKWLNCGSTQISSNRSWSGESPFQGSNKYFASTSSGFGSDNSFTGRSSEISFYVTNCEAVEVIGYRVAFGGFLNQNGHLNAYECTEKQDGSLTESSTASKTAATQWALLGSGEYTLQLTGLDTDKIYKVTFTGDRGILAYEIAFQTPAAVTLNELVTRSDITVNKKYTMEVDDLTAVYLSDDGKTLYCKDGDAYANRSTKERGAVDYVQEKTGLMNGAYDQSNWVALNLPQGGEAEFSYTLVGKRLKRVRGQLRNKTNPELLISATSMPVANGSDPNDYAHNLNVFVLCNFMGSTQTSPVWEETFFFVTPKPMEVGQVEWAMWDASSQMFVVPPKMVVNGVNINGYQLDGGVYTNFSLLSSTPSLEDGGIYRITALMRKESAKMSVMHGKKRAVASGNYVMYPLSAPVLTGKIEGSVVTGVSDLASGGGKEVKEVLRYDLNGRQLRDKQRGVNIEVTIYTDGTRSVEKRIY
ncbi:MAG: hypothetical protein IJ626_03755 [Muribaculaceae bacterium]|nr:hypothetical protein [Muribaculaceae bacterium]